MEGSELLDELQDTVGMGASVPFHAVERLRALLCGDEVVYLDARLAPDDPGVCSGQILLMTADRVLLAELVLANGHPRFDEGPTYTVTVETWPRKALSGLVLAGDSTKGHNRDDRWLQDYGDLWPHDAKLSLHYEGHATLTLPLADDPQKAARIKFRSEIVPSLVKDLG